MDFSQAAEQEKPEQTQAVTVTGNYDLKPVRKELASYEKGLVRMEKEAGALVVNSKDNQARAIEIAGGAKTLGKNLKKAMDTMIAPANDWLKTVRNLFRGHLDRLDAIEKRLKDKAGAFEVQERLAQQRKEAEAREEARKLQEKIDAEARAQREEAERKAREAAEKLKTEQDEAARAILQQTVEEETAAAQIQTPQVVVPVVTAAPTVTRTETGSGHMRMVWEIEVIDAAQVPDKYKVVDEKLIRADVKAGIREIPGVKIFEKPVMAIRT